MSTTPRWDRGRGGRGCSGDVMAWRACAGERARGRRRESFAFGQDFFLKSSESVSLTHLLAWRTGPHAHTRCTRLAREPTRGTLSPAVALGPDCWTHNTQLTGQLTRWRCIVGFSGTDTGEEGGAQGRGHRTYELISQPAPGAVARASAGVFGPAVWQAPGHRSAGRAFKPHPRSAPALRRDPARC